MNGLELREVTHHYGRLRAVDCASLAVAPGEVVCLLGASGCGKTTLLRLAAGLEPLQAGQVLIDGRVVADERGGLPPEQRGVGMLFQDYALFPHLSVLDNVGFGLHRLSREARQARSLEVLRMVGLAEYARAFPHTLSGGQQQRAALARALAPRPPVMLLDEPFGGLDRRLREQVRGDTLRILQESGAAVLMVTHDPEEAMAMGDRLAVMSEGRIEQVGKPSEVYTRPATPFVARFLGELNRFEGTVQGGVVSTPLGPIPATGLEDGASAEVLIRPEHLSLARPQAAEAANGTVRQARLTGPTTQVEVDLDRAVVQALLLGPTDLRPGNRVLVRLEPGRAAVFAAAGQVVSREGTERRGSPTSSGC